MDDYFSKAKIDNPLNIKRISGDLPTTKSSSKNVFVLLISFSVIGLTVNKVWQFSLFYLKSPVLTAIVLGLMYAVIIFKIFSVSIFEEKKQRKAYKDLLDNRMSDLSVIWEIQDIKEEEIMGTKVAYIDYIDGSRTVLLKCIPGSILNLDESTPKYHYNSLEHTFKYIDDLGYEWHPHAIEEAVTDDKALSFYYDQLKEYTDEEFISIFTEQLDTIAYVSEIRSAIHVTYIEITGKGKYKHNMINNLFSLPEIMGTNNIFKSVELVSKKSDLDSWIAYINSVSMFDREELIMNKYKNTFNLGLTSVLASFSHTGELIRRFNKDFDIKKLVRKKSIDVIKRESRDKYLEEEETISIEKELIPKTKEDVIQINKLSDTKDTKFIELMYSKDKVKLGK